MKERRELLASIANTIKDYRTGDLPEPTPDHADRWIRQFEAEFQLPMLREMDHVLRQTYFSRSRVRDFFASVTGSRWLAGEDPREFWRAAHLLDIQQGGNSQTEIRKLFSEELERNYGLAANAGVPNDVVFVYLDDVLFTGSRIGNDLSAWIVDVAPQAGTVHVLTIASHSFGEWKCSTRLQGEAASAGKQLRFHFWTALRIENRLSDRNTSEVLWPAVIPDDAALAAYMAEERKFPFQRRAPGGQFKHGVFSSEEGRQLLERELLLAGMRIRSLSREPYSMMRPLGFSPFGLGFGSTVVTYRNCPNNAPLALWWGDPRADAAHPFAHWYPLVQRRTYAS